MPYGVGLQDERPTSNVQRRTSNNDVAPLRNLISFVFINTMLDVRCSFFVLPGQNNLTLMHLNSLIRRGGTPDT
jgi:hypothetical protein